MKKVILKNEERVSIALERATSDNIDDFLELERSVEGHSTYSAMTNRAEVLEEIRKNVVYLIRKDDHTVGSIMYEMKTPKHAHISGLVVHPDVQGQGIGKAAMIKVLKELAYIPVIDLVTHPDNERAIRLYESLGFTLGECIENYFGDGEPRVVLTLRKKN